MKLSMKESERNTTFLPLLMLAASGTCTIHACYGTRFQRGRALLG